MDYSQFVVAVKKELKSRLGDGVKVNGYSAVKNNSTVREGILIEDGEANISPVIYLEEFYEDMRGGTPFSDVVSDVEEFYESIRARNSIDCDMILDFKGVKDRIVFRLIQTSSNRELLKEVPSREVLDLSVVFYILVDMDRNSTATILVNNIQAEYWGVDAADLWKIASSNSQRLLPAYLYTMEYVMTEMFSSDRENVREQNLLRDGEAQRDTMYVLTNGNQHCGAGCMLYDGVLETAWDRLGEDYYLIPSSIHEMLLVPASSGAGFTEFEKMIRQVNETQVPADEVLGNHAYFYSRKRKCLETGSQTERKVASA